MTSPDHPAWQLLAALPLAAGEPTMNAEMSFRIVSRAIHLVCAIILGGGVFYMRSVLSYAGPDACFAGRRQVWARWVAVASTLLLASGMYNYLANVWASKVPGATALPFAYHILFGIKFLLGLFVMFVAALVGGKSAGAEKARANIGRWLNLAWSAVMAIVILGAMMRFMH
jgi:hypothetical protein